LYALSLLFILDTRSTQVPRNKKNRRSHEENLTIPAECKENIESEFVFPTTPYLPAPDDSAAKAYQRRVEQERKVALEALKLVEQRRMRDPLVPSPNQANENSEKTQPVVHLYRSPIRFSPEERLKVDNWRIAKRDRIEKVILEMDNEKKEQQQLQLQREKRILAPNRQINVQKKPEMEKETKEKEVATKRYIPTAKEWSELRRAKHLAKMEVDKENVKPAKTKPPVTKANENNGMPLKSSKEGDPGPSPPKPLYIPPGKLLEGEKRRGNRTHFQLSRKFSNRRSSNGPITIVLDLNGKIVQRYSIEELLQFEPQPEDLEKPHFDENFKRFGFLCD